MRMAAGLFPGPPHWVLCPGQHDMMGFSLGARHVCGSCTTHNLGPVGGGQKRQGANDLPGSPFTWVI